MEWVKVKTRKLTEMEQYLYPEIEFMWDMLTPEWNIDILLTDGNAVWVERWIEDDDYRGFEDSYPDDYDNLWYMPFPEPPEMEVEEVK